MGRGEGVSLAERARVEREKVEAAATPLLGSECKINGPLLFGRRGTLRFLAQRLCVQLSPYVARFERANWNAARPSDPGIRSVRIVVAF